MKKNFSEDILESIPEYQVFRRVLSDQTVSLPDGEPAQEITVDRAYAGEELEKLAAGKNITLQATSLTGKLPNDVFADFVLKEGQKEILSCPAGHEPTGCSFHENTGKITATMPGNCCASCPNRETCKARGNKKKSRSKVSIHVKNVITAKKARQIKSEEDRETANSRNGVEGILSVMRRKYGLDG